MSVLGHTHRPGEVPPQTTGWTLCPNAAPETPFQSHPPSPCVTVRPPYASHTLQVDFGPRSASLVSCFLLLGRQACACLRGLSALDLLATASVGARPHRKRQRRAKCKTLNCRSSSLYFYSGRTTGARLPLSTVMTVWARPLGVADHPEGSPTRSLE